MINSRSIEDLDPHVQNICHEHVRLCAVQGVTLLITSTYRDFEAQDALYAVGRTVQMERKPVTKARAGQSWHNYRCAWDVVPVVAGKAVWKASDPLWKIVEVAGLQAGASRGPKWDLPHYQVLPPAPISYATARQSFEAAGTIFV